MPAAAKPTQGGLPSVTAGDLTANDPARLNRALNLLAMKLHEAAPGKVNMGTLPRVTADDLKNNSPASLNSALRLFSTQLVKLQATPGKAPQTMNGLPAITNTQDPEPINRALNLIASQVHELV